MGRYDDIDPQDIDPDTGRPYAGYSSPSLDTSFHDGEMAGEDDDYDDSYPGPCTDPGGHKWPRDIEESDRCLCVHCGADGDA